MFSEEDPYTHLGEQLLDALGNSFLIAFAFREEFFRQNMEKVANLKLSIILKHELNMSGHQNIMTFAVT